MRSGSDAVLNFFLNTTTDNGHEYTRQFQYTSYTAAVKIFGPRSRHRKAVRVLNLGGKQGIHCRFQLCNNLQLSDMQFRANFVPHPHLRYPQMGAHTHTHVHTHTHTHTHNIYIRNIPKSSNWYTIISLTLLANAWRSNASNLTVEDVIMYSRLQHRRCLSSFLLKVNCLVAFAHSTVSKILPVCTS